jgi:hypothetical protein
MVSESICLAILRFMRGHKLTVTQTVAEGEPSRSTEEDAAAAAHIYRNLLRQYSLADIDAAMRWLELGEYFGRSGFGIHGPFWHVLTDKGRQVADSGSFSEEEKRLLYQEQEPYEVFMAHQFNTDDTDLVSYIREKVLEPLGFTMLDGRADGLEEFRTSILAKMRRARFFLCLLTKRRELASGEFASRVWLYQETGAAVAFGKKPLLLVEDGISSEYVGELQSIYEHIIFTRSNHPSRFEAIGRRFLADLEANNIPKPRGRRLTKRSS